LRSENNTARTFYNLIINKTSGTVQYYSGLFDGAFGFHLTISNNFTITSGNFNTKESTTGTSRDLTVTGDTLVSGTLVGNASTISFGSLRINSGGTYSATSGTTTCSGDWTNAGTFTHSSGTVAFGTSNVTAGGDPFNIITVTTTIAPQDLVECINSTIVASKVDATSGALLIKQYGTTTGLYYVYGETAQSSPKTYTFTSGTLDDGITIKALNPNAGSTMFTFDTNRFVLKKIDMDPGTTVRVNDDVNIYTDTFDLNGTWDKSAGYGGLIHIGYMPWEAAPYDAVAIIDSFYDSSAVYESRIG